MLDKVKLALRISNDAYDSEITSLINACKRELELVGIASSNFYTSDYMITQAIILYCKANFGFDNSEADRYQKAYESLKSFLTLCLEYTEEEE